MNQISPLNNPWEVDMPLKKKDKSNVTYSRQKKKC